MTNPSTLREAIHKALLPTAESIAGEWGGGETGEDAYEYIPDEEIDAILDAVIAELPDKEMLRNITETMNDDYHRGKFDAIETIRLLLTSAKGGTEK